LDGCVEHLTSEKGLDSDWVVVMDRGAIIEQGPPRQIFRAPTVERTRSFLSHLGWSG
jgi:polar amino acid transport system ATP-binding protein